MKLEKIKPLIEALSYIAGDCENLTSGRCIDDPSRIKGYPFGHARVCDRCIAMRALEEFDIDF